MIEEVVGRWNNKRKRKVGKVYLLKKINVKNKYRKIEKKKKKNNNNNNFEVFQATTTKTTTTLKPFKL